MIDALSIETIRSTAAVERGDLYGRTLVARLTSRASFGTVSAIRGP